MEASATCKPLLPGIEPKLVDVLSPSGMLLMCYTKD